MYIPLKLGAIEQQHLQELYELAGVPRDELPYSPTLTQVCADFQDRTFKNANEAQVFGALLKYVRSSRCAKAPKAGKKDKTSPEASAERMEQARLLRAQRASMARLQPYTTDFESARAAFARNGGPALSPKEFWSVVQLAAAPAPGAAKARRLQPQPA